MTMVVPAKSFLVDKKSRYEAGKSSIPGSRGSQGTTSITGPGQLRRMFVWGVCGSHNLLVRHVSCNNCRTGGTVKICSGRFSGTRRHSLNRV